MKFNIFLLFCLCFTSNLLTASSLDGNTVDAQEQVTMAADDVSDVLALVDSDISVVVVDDEICYSASVGINIMGVVAQVTVRGCGATSAEAWSEFRSAMLLARNEQ